MGTQGKMLPERLERLKDSCTNGVVAFLEQRFMSGKLDGKHCGVEKPGTVMDGFLET